MWVSWRTVLPFLSTAAIAVCLAAGPASARQGTAADLADAAGAAFHSGDYRRAVELGRAAHSAAGSALAAWAELAQGNFLDGADERLRDFRLSEQDARRAIALDPDEPEGHLALALALGFIGRAEGGLAAHLEGLAGEARRHIGIALALSPRNPWANALLGGWNLEIVGDGGRLGGRLYGASVEEGKAAYARALALDPENSQIAYQFALDLLALGGEANRDAAQRLLSDIVRRGPGDPLDRLVQARARTLAGALLRHDEEAVAGLLQDQLGGR